jgi:four helix bundle protein
MDFVIACYRLTDQFPKSETYGLASQLRRAAVSVPANIAEGHCRRRTKEFLHHLDIAYGSLGEAETHVEIAVRLEFVGDAEASCAREIAAEVGRVLNGLIESLRRKLAAES